MSNKTYSKNTEQPRTLKADLEFGKGKEIEILPIIRDYFKDDINFVKYEYSTYDFRGKQYKYELKSRTTKYEDYDTTLLPESKIKYNKYIYFLFNFTDGLYYIKYEPNIFSTFKVEKFCRNKRSDYNDTPKNYIYIPITSLIKIN